MYFSFGVATFVYSASLQGVQRRLTFIEQTAAAAACRVELVFMSLLCNAAYAQCAPRNAPLTQLAVCRFAVGCCYH